MIPEIQFIVQSLRHRLGSQEEPANGSVHNVEKLLALASAHGVTALLEGAPDDAIPRILAGRMDNAKRGMALTSMLLMATAHMRDYRIRTVTFKGPILAACYGDPSLREFSDVDILMAAEDVEKAIEALALVGFVPELPWTETSIRRWNCQISLRHDRTSGHLDLHWQLVPRYFPVQWDVAELLDRAKQTDLQRIKVPVLAPEDQVILACVHGAKHGWERLLWLYDIAMLVRAHPNIQWRDIFERADKLGARNVVVSALMLLEHILGVELPLEASPDADVHKTLTPWVLNIGWRIGQGITGPVDSVELIKFNNALVSSRWQRMKHWVGAVTYPTDVEAAACGAAGSVSSVLIPYRVARLALKYGLRGKKS
ncbi:MAG: nucleotidyltransferase family protein [Bryobacteraceae bacterium]